MSLLDPNPETVAEDQVMSEVHWGCSPHLSKCLSTFRIRSFVGVVMARKAQLVFLTDYSRDVLDNCYRNVWLNLHNRNESSERVKVRQLDWNTSWPPDASTEDGCLGGYLQPYSWSSSDIEDALSTSIFLAADVVYNDSLTDAFFRILEKMMPSKSKQVLWLALEKRYNFSIEELNVVAHGYDHFLTFLIDEAKVPFKQEAGEDRRKFIGKQIDLDKVPQYIHDYERTTDLELWEIRRR